VSIGEELERLAGLHAAGALDDAEYTAAKSRLLAELGSSPDIQRPPDPPARPQRTNGNAIASLVLGLVGVGVGHVLAVVLGLRAKRQIDASNGRERGRGLAVAGLVLGWVGIAAAVVLSVLYFAYGRDATSGPSSETVISGEDEGWDTTSALIAVPLVN